MARKTLAIASRVPLQSAILELPLARPVGFERRVSLFSAGLLGCSEPLLKAKWKSLANPLAKLPMANR